jgi:cytochrome c oxidase subunit 1
MWHLDLFSWSMLIVSFIQIMATPIITTAVISVSLDRMYTTGIFSAADAGGGPILFQHVFWAYSHPAVYILLIPAMGLTSLIISKFTQRPIFGYKSMVWSQLAITILGFTVWGHHIYAAGEGNTVHSYFFIATALIAVPSAVKMFNWLMTLKGANIRFEAPLLFMAGWLFGFTLGGVTGIFLNIIPMDYFLQDTYWVVGHFHFVVIGGTVTTFFGALYYMFPHVFRKMYSHRIAVAHFIFWILGYTLTFGSQLILGLLAMPRRYYAYPNFPQWVLWNQVATIGAYSMAIAGILFAFNMLYYMFKGRKVVDVEDPFGIGENGISPHLIAAEV